MQSQAQPVREGSAITIGMYSTGSQRARLRDMREVISGLLCALLIALTLNAFATQRQIKVLRAEIQSLHESVAAVQSARYTESSGTVIATVEQVYMSVVCLDGSNERPGTPCPQ